MAHDYSMELLFIQKQFLECVEKYVVGEWKREIALEVLEMRKSRYGNMNEGVFENLQCLDDPYDGFNKDLLNIVDGLDIDYPSFLSVYDKCIQTVEGEEVGKYLEFAFYKNKTYRDALRDIECYSPSQTYTVDQIRQMTYRRQISDMYSSWEHDLAILVEKGIVKQQEDCSLVWLRSKQSLAEYFDKRKKANRNIWNVIESVFYIGGKKVSGLKDSLNGNGGKPSKDIEEIERILRKGDCPPD